MGLCGSYDQGRIEGHCGVCECSLRGGYATRMSWWSPLAATPITTPRARMHSLVIAVGVVGMLMTWPELVCAQHGNYVLGTLGLFGGAQAPEGIYYQNIFSYYHSSNSGILEATRARDLTVFGRQLGLTVNAAFNAKSSMDVYIDQNIIGMTTPFKILGANYGFMIDIPFDNAHGTGDASLDVGADLRGLFDRNFTAGASVARSRSGTADFNIADIYVEAINLGWHFPQLDVLATMGFFAPTGAYSANRVINNGLGRWAEMFGMGAVGYLDRARSWSISAMTRYLTHQSQQGVDIRVGDDFILEWGLGKTFRPPAWKPWVTQLDTGVIGYAQWQLTDNRGSAIPIPLRRIRSNIFGVGPEIATTTKFGRFFARYEFEFGAQNSPQGHIFLFGLALLYDPFK